MFKKSEKTGEFYSEALFDSGNIFDELKQIQKIEESRNPNAKLLVSQSSIIEKAKNFNKQRIEYKKRMTNFKTISMDNDGILETNKSSYSDDSKLNSSIINKYKRKTITEVKNPKISFNQTYNLSCAKANTNTISTINNNGSKINQKNNYAGTNEFHKKIKNPLLFDSDEMLHKYDLANMIPTTSILKVDEQKFITRGEVKKYIASKNNMRKSKKSCEKILTPFQKYENCKNLLREKLTINQVLLGEKAALFNRNYDSLKNIDPDELQHPASTCTIFNFNSTLNSKNNFKEIYLTKLTKDNSLFDLGKTTKEILPNIGYQSTSSTGFGFISDKKKGTKTDSFANVNYLSKLLSHTKSDFGKMQNSYFNRTASERFGVYNNKNQDSYYGNFKNYKLENKDKKKKDDDTTNKVNYEHSNSINNVKTFGFIHRNQTIEYNQNNINKPKYSNVDVTDKKRTNLFKNKISSNDVNSNENKNYKTSVNFFKNIKSNSDTSGNFNLLAQDIKSIPSSGKSPSPSGSHNLDLNNNFKGKAKNNEVVETNLNVDSSACQTNENNDDKNEGLIKSNKNSKINLKKLDNNTKANKKINFNLNSFNHTYNTKFSNSNYNINLLNNSNKNKKTNEIYTSTEKDEKLYNELTSNEKLIKIDYDKPAKSTNDILSYIIKTNTTKVKAIDPLLNNQRFFIHSQQNFANINNKFFQESKNSFYKKGFKNFDFKTNKNSKYNLKKGENNRMVSDSNQNVNEKFYITTTNLNESFTCNGNYQNGYEDIPVPSIFKARSTSYFTKFFKRNKF